MQDKKAKNNKENDKEKDEDRKKIKEALKRLNIDKKYDQK